MSHRSATLHTVLPRSHNRHFAGLFLAAYLLLLVDLLTTGGLVSSWPPLLLGTLFALAGTLGFPLVARAGRPALTYAYFILMLPLGAVIFQRSPTGGTFLMLVVAAQSMRVLPLIGVLLLGLPLPLLHMGMAWPYSLREGATLLVALMFLYVLNRVIVSAEQAQAALTLANQQLRDYAAQREELAAARERNRIAREIHDGLGHYLTTIHMQIQAALAIKDQDRPRAEQTLAKAQGLALEALRDVRRSVSALRVDPSEEASLPDLLRTLADATTAAGVPVTVTVLEEVRPLGPQAEQALYRAAQEGLTNVRKHAAASSAAITLDYRNPTTVGLVVQDDGKGAATITGGFGLVGLRERVQLLGGSLCVETAAGAGLVLRVEVPG